MREIRSSDVLVVVRLDRLARSVSHLLEVIERLEDGGAHFRSLRDPIDTSTPQGMFSLQVLGAVAQLERALKGIWRFSTVALVGDQEVAHADMMLAPGAVPPGAAP